MSGNGMTGPLGGPVSTQKKRYCQRKGEYLHMNSRGILHVNNAYNETSR